MAVIFYSVENVYILSSEYGILLDFKCYIRIFYYNKILVNKHFTNWPSINYSKVVFDITLENGNSLKNPIK